MAEAQEVVRWRDLTPAAQYVLWEEVDRLLAKAPNRETIHLVRAELVRHPGAIPGFIKNMKTLLAKETS